MFPRFSRCAPTAWSLVFLVFHIRGLVVTLWNTCRYLETHDMSSLHDSQIKLGTPVISIDWPSFTKPDQFGKLGFLMVFDPSDSKHSAFLKKLDAAVDKLKKVIESSGESYKYISDPNIKSQIDRDKNPTGNLSISTGVQHKGTNKKGEPYVRYIPVVDTQGNEVPHDALVNLRNGTLVRVGLNLTPYIMKTGMAGVSIKPAKVQLVKPVTNYVPDDSEYFDEDVDTDMYDYAAPTTSSVTSVNTEDNADETDDF